MAAEKRALPAKVAAMKARKKQKLDPDAKKDAPKTKRKVDLNSLAWKEVSMPDRLEDYEGFFGLEEIDDVEVTRDDSGKVSYQAPSATTSGEDGREPEADPANDDDDGSSWSGFDDEERSESVVEKPAKETKAKKKPKQKEPKPDSKSKAKANGTGHDAATAPNGDFQALSDGAEDDGVDVSAWRDLKLSPDTMASLSKLRFATPTPIQRSIIPEILEGHDVVGKASTGSGKTLAFGIPILERYLETTVDANGKPTRSTPLALVLSPTRELAHQLEKHMSALFGSVLWSKPSIATLTGGLSLHKQQRQLKDADVVVGTPGRLWEIISSGQGIGAALKQIDFLVIDEADRLLSEGHFKEVEEIINALDREDTNDADEEAKDTTASKADFPSVKRQTLVFSATFDRGLQKKLVGKLNRRDNLLGKKETMEYLISKLNFREDAPKFVDVNPIKQLATGLKEGLVECAGTEKDLYLYALLLLNSTKRAMVFTNSISAVRRITPLLQYLNLNALALHSGMMQKARLRSVERFASTKNANSNTGPVVLVATDVAARGLDIPSVDLIVHYHLPRAADTYVHRSGRTARAGLEGSSVLLCAPEEVAGVRRLVAKVHAHSAASQDKSASNAAKQGYFIRTLDIDRRVVSRLKERLTLAKKLADATIAKEKQHKEDDFMRAAAEELGVEYDSEEFEKQAPGRHGRGAGRKKKEREARGMSKGEVVGMKAQLNDMLRQRVNVGVSEKYLTSGRVDVDELLRQQDAGAGKTGEFLGTVGSLGLEDL